LFRRLRVLLLRHYVLIVMVAVLARNGLGDRLGRVIVDYVSNKIKEL
jgi:hypothetical protein